MIQFVIQLTLTLTESIQAQHTHLPRFSFQGIPPSTDGRPVLRGAGLALLAGVHDDVQVPRQVHPDRAARLCARRVSRHRQPVHLAQGDDDRAQHHRRQAVGGQPRRHGNLRRAEREGRQMSPEVSAVLVLYARHAAARQGCRDGQLQPGEVGGERYVGQQDRDSARDVDERLDGEPGVQDGQLQDGLDAPHAAAGQRSVLQLHPAGLPAERAGAGRGADGLAAPARPTPDGGRQVE